MRDRSDHDLVELARGGESDAFGVLVRRHQPRIFRLAVHMLKNEAEAEDVAQDTFVRALRALDRFDGRSEPFTWLYRIAVNLCLNLLRGRRVRRHQDPDDPRLEVLLVEHHPSRTAQDEALAAQRAAAVLATGLDVLSEALRTTLILVGLEGLSHAQAAEILGCPEGTVAWRVHEARRRLRLHLEKHGYVRESEGER